MFTKRLYDENSYIREFDARVLSCEEGKNGYEVVLDESAFFPEGGGQPADQGFLNNVRVTDVRDKKDYVLHICSQSLEPGSLVHGRIDWERRFLHMQQHSVFPRRDARDVRCLVCFDNQRKVLLKQLVVHIVYSLSLIVSRETYFTGLPR